MVELENKETHIRWVWREMSYVVSMGATYSYLQLREILTFISPDLLPFPPSK